MKSKLQSLKTWMLSAFILAGTSTYAQFSGNYVPSNWTFEVVSPPSDGYVDVSGAPMSIILGGDDDGSGAPWADEHVSYSVTVCTDGFITFDYSHVNPDVDEAFYAINGTRTMISSGSGTGTMGPIAVSAGDVFSFLVVSYDDCCGRGILTISNFSAPQPTVTVDAIVSPTTCGGNDGSIAVTISNGVAPYTYDWNMGMYTVEDITGLTSGGYGLQVTDANGCSVFEGMILNDQGAPTITVDAVTNVSCNGAGDGAIAVTTTGATAPYLFNWNSGMFTTEDITGLSGGLYYLAATDALGCTAWEYLDVNEPQPFSVAVDTVINNMCNGFWNGSVYVTSFGGTQPISYDWNTGMYTTEDLNLVPAGPYNLTATDASGCTATASAVVTEPTAINASIIGTNADCNGASTGAADLTVTGGTPPYTFSWNGGIYTTEDLTNIPAGSYFVDIWDANNCNTSASVVITEPTAITVTGDAAVNPTTCGGSDGSIAVTPTGGTPGYTYDWNAGAYTVEDITGLTAGTYNLVVTDANGCTGSFNTQLSDPGAPSIAADLVTNVTCNAGSDGAIAVTVTGGTAPYSYDWNAGTYTIEDLTGLTAGVYNLVVSDAGGCTAAVSLTVSEPAVISANLDMIQHVQCNGAASGSIFVTPTGGTGPYTFDWNTGAYTTEDITSVLAGPYNLVITDVNGCTGSFNTTINELPAITSTAVITDVSCNGGNDGAIDVTVTGGTPAYNYQWNMGTYWTEDISGLSAATYTLELWDWNGCYYTTSYTVNEPTPVVATVDSVFNVDCNGNNNGAVYITASGGTPGYAFDWNTGTYTTEDITGLAPATYNVVVTDANGCMGTNSATITEPTALTLTTDLATNVDCNGNATGAIAVTVTGGTTPYAYDWNAGAYTVEDISALPANTYNLTVTDANGCTISGSETVTEPAVLAAVIDSSMNIDCNGNATGAVYTTVSGGTAAYTFDWNTGAYATEDITGLVANTYNLSVTDANGCTTTASAILTEPAVLTASTTQVDVDCNGNNNGSIDLTVAGGTTGYAFDWNTGTYTTEDLTGLAPATYSVVVTDTNGCTATASATITEPTALTATLDASTDPSTCGATDGSIMVTTTGGTTSYAYDWNSGTYTTEDISGLGLGIYSLTITDANGCTFMLADTLFDPTSLAVVVDSTTDVLCNGDATGAVSVTSTGGSVPYTYDWNSGTYTTEDITGLSAGSYSVIVTDANNCSAVAAATVNEPTVLSAMVDSTTDVLCNGDAAGAIYASASGGTMPYAYDWNSGAYTTEDITGLVANTYNLSVTDANGCTTTASATISEPTALALSATSTDEILGSDGAIDLTVSGGTAAYSYAWDNSATTEDLTGLTAGTYVVTVTDANGCTGTLSVTIASQVSVVELGNLNLNVYPNPSNGIVYLEFSQVTEGSITIYDAVGQIVAKEQITNIKQTINLENNERGIYFLHVENNKYKKIINVILQ